MSQWRPCKRRNFIKRLRKLGFEGPYSGTRHQFMVLGKYRPESAIFLKVRKIFEPVLDFGL